MSYYRYATEDEIDFLNNLGNHRKEDFGGTRVKRVSTEERIALLQKYLKSSEKRSDWGLINREVVTGYARNLLAQLREH